MGDLELTLKRGRTQEGKKKKSKKSDSGFQCRNNLKGGVLGIRTGFYSTTFSFVVWFLFVCLF